MAYPFTAASLIADWSRENPPMQQAPSAAIVMREVRFSGPSQLHRLLILDDGTSPVSYQTRRWKACVKCRQNLVRPHALILAANASLRECHSRPL